MKCVEYRKQQIVNTILNSVRFLSKSLVLLNTYLFLTNLPNCAPLYLHITYRSLRICVRVSCFLPTLPNNC